MSLPEKKVRALIKLMNSVSKFRLPAVKPLLDCFELAMDERTLDFLLAAGTGPYTADELKDVYRRLFGPADVETEWSPFLDGVLEMCFLYPTPDKSQYVLAPIFPGWIELSSSGVGPQDEKRKAILNRFMDYWKLMRLLNIAPVRMWDNYVKTRDTGSRKSWFSATITALAAASVSISAGLMCARWSPTSAACSSRQRERPRKGVDAMHEAAVCCEIMDIAERAAAENDLKEIVEITVTVGAYSCVNERQLNVCFDAIKSGSCMACAVIRVERDESLTGPMQIFVKSISGN